MSYQGISIKEAMIKINASVNGWFLPAEQRPYVWGSRYEGEIYICKLFDSLFRGYPIGGLILWNTSKAVQHREFMTDYLNDANTKIVDKGLWERPDKWLVYDGQQRLQTLFSCLRFTFNGKVLVFDLLSDFSKAEEGEITGFKFIDKNEAEPRAAIRMNELFSQSAEDKEEYKYKKKILSRWSDLSEPEHELAEQNMGRLWKVFVETDKKSLSFFPLTVGKEDEVNEIFQRLNTGGVALSQADLLFSRIKGESHDFEEILQGFSKRMFESTGSGYFFSAYEILQLIYLIIKGTTRVDSNNIPGKKDLLQFVSIWKDLEAPLTSFLSDFLWARFKINNNRIISKKLALHPLIVFLYVLSKNEINFNKMTTTAVNEMERYLILSQINDWNTLGIVDNFTSIVQNNKNSGVFPLDKMIEWLKLNKKRNVDIFETAFTDYQWFALKVLIPDRMYHFDPDSKGRVNPEIDHIFPRALDDSKEYQEAVNCIWNLQPVKGDVNNYKRKKHPRDFFVSEDGKKYMNEYNFLPTTDLSDDLWNNPLEFIEKRRILMIAYMKNQYNLDLKDG